MEEEAIIEGDHLNAAAGCLLGLFLGFIVWVIIIGAIILFV